MKSSLSAVLCRMARRATAHLALAQDYDKVLRSRNRVLKQAEGGGLPSSQLDGLLEVSSPLLARAFRGTDRRRA